MSQLDKDYIETFWRLEKNFYQEVKISGLKQRIKKLKSLKKWIFCNQQSIEEAVYNDFKKPQAEVDITEIRPVISEINHALKHLKKWASPKKAPGDLSLTGTKSRIIKEPLGVVLIIAPWNFPFNLTIGPFVSALAAGNNIIIKPSEITPYTSSLIKNMVEQLYSSDQVQVFTGDATVAASLLKLPFNHIFFTGSPEVGKIVMREAAENLTSVTLELGGQNPVVVDATADLFDTAEKLIYGKFMNAGQSCISVNYIMVEEKIMEELLENLKKAFFKLYGDEENVENNPDIARIVNKKHYKRISNLLDDAEKKGANIILGGKRNEDECFISPTIIKDVPQNAFLMQEEIFGPIIPVISWKDKKEVFEHIKARPTPLALYIFSGKEEFIREIISRTSAGTTGINETTLQFVNPNLPFGGVNYSGIGKGHGYWGFMAFSNQRAILRQRKGFTIFKLVYPPYNKKVKNIIQAVLKYL